MVVVGVCRFTCHFPGVFARTVIYRIVVRNFLHHTIVLIIDTLDFLYRLLRAVGISAQLFFCRHIPFVSEHTCSFRSFIPLSGSTVPAIVAATLFLTVVTIDRIVLTVFAQIIADKFPRSVVPNPIFITDLTRHVVISEQLLLIVGKFIIHQFVSPTFRHSRQIVINIGSFFNNSTTAVISQHVIQLRIFTTDRQRAAK